ncbi:hypothetical protein [Chryseolinea lacunae]|uniref:Uncharacterized protein n=1 Tax=Chryseolinea lacunae TaxID=2801331 RepID=A0ABS1KU20_9BACT|nr:hypothetical protein [Chryseolinea lacunae]MBL0742951.1 hypothetical protein [Chryseolinea lacunae]
MKFRVSPTRLVLYSILVLLTLFVNIIVRPYPTKYAAIGIDTIIDEDAVLVGFILSVMLLLCCVGIFMYVRHTKQKMDAWLIGLLIANSVAVFYWYSYNPG